MKTSQNITVTDARTKRAFHNLITEAVMPSVHEAIQQEAENFQIATGVMTKFYPYLDKAEVKLDNANEKILCKIMHRFDGNIIDFFTPQGNRKFDDKRKEPYIAPLHNLHCLIMDINDNTKEYLLLGYYTPKNIVGIRPASQGAMRICSIGATKENYIEFNGAKLKIQTSKGIQREKGQFNTDTETVEYANSKETYTKEELYTKAEVEELIDMKITEALSNYDGGSG
jgi:hypothetical protein